MTGIVDWAAGRTRMVLAFILLSLVVGGYSYSTLPKEGEPDIEIPALFVSVQFPGISAADSETLLVKPMETELADLDGLKQMTGTAAENYAGVALEFEFGWDKTKIMADVRDAMSTAEAQFPEGYEKYSINEINFSEFPIIIVNLTGPVPERTMARVARDLQDELEALDSVLEAGLAGDRDEMLEVLIDPLRLEAYNVTAGELINVVQNNNQLIAAGEIESEQGTFAVKIPSSFDEPRDVYALPVKTNGDRVVTLGDLAQINLTFEDRQGTARFNGEKTLALQVVKRKGFNLIDTSEQVKEIVEARAAEWPDGLQAAVTVGTSNDQSRIVDSMVQQLLGSVFTAIALVMIVVLAALGIRAALLVGFAIPTSFLLCFAFLALMGISISNIVMFGLILAVGMLVDGAIVVVEYADARQQQGEGPMQAYVSAAKRMFWPIISSTATTLCAFLPMLFWPGVPGEFMGMLPVTLSATTAYFRSACLQKAADNVLARKDHIANLMSREQGKPLRAALNEVNYAADFLRWYAEEAKRNYGQTVPSARADQRFICLKVPVGVVAAITPWNYPVSMITRKVAPALAAGCTVVLKPAESTPLCAIAMFEALADAGIPDGVINLVTAAEPRAIGQQFLDDPRVAKITFTGSTAVGKFLASGAGKSLKRVSLELGGHAPFIVFADADPQHAAKGAALVKFLNTGQACISPNRLYVHESLMDHFVTTLRERTARLKAGSGLDQGVSIGPLVNSAALEKVSGQVDDALDKGASLVCGGEVLRQGDLGSGHFYAPTVLSGITPEMRIYHEETFGPVAPIIAFNDDDDIFAMANDTHYGLAAYVYTESVNRAFKAMEKLRFGIIGINDINPTSAAAPFGGLQDSGLGREGGSQGLDEYLETKTAGIALNW